MFVPKFVDLPMIDDIRNKGRHDADGEYARACIDGSTHVEAAPQPGAERCRSHLPALLQEDRRM